MPVLVPVTTAISMLGLLWFRSLGAAFQQGAGRKARRGPTAPGIATGAGSAGGSRGVGSDPTPPRHSLPTRRLREADEQVAQVGGVRRVAQHGAHAEDLLERAQRRAV